jgi:energy-coupling factor transporter transmembrane protein EcfT
MHDTPDPRSGMVCIGALTLVFIVLKLLGKLTWAWGWVLAPLWIAALLTAFIVGVVGVIAYLRTR